MEENTTTQAANNAGGELKQLPNAKGAFIMGIVAFCLTWSFYLAIGGVVLGFIAMSKAKKDKHLWENDQTPYRREMWKVKLGRILGLIAVILGIVFVILGIVIAVAAA